MSGDSFHRWYDNIVFHEQLLGVPTSPGRYVVGSQYTGIDVSDWDYLVIDVKRAFSGADNVLGCAVTWTDDMNTFAITTGLGVRGHWQSTEWFTLFTVPTFGTDPGTEAFWCIPIKGQFANVMFQSQNVNLCFANVMVGLMRGTRLIPRTRDNDLILNYTAPGTATGGTFRSDAICSTLGRARAHGYVFNNSANGVTIGRLYEVNEAGAGEEILYIQHPPGAAANSVYYFDFDFPLRGRVLSFQGVVAAGALGNARISVSAYPE